MGGGVVPCCPSLSSHYRGPSVQPPSDQWPAPPVIAMNALSVNLAFIDSVSSEELRQASFQGFGEARALVAMHVATAPAARHSRPRPLADFDFHSFTISLHLARWRRYLSAQSAQLQATGSHQPRGRHLVSFPRDLPRLSFGPSYLPRPTPLPSDSVWFHPLSTLRSDTTHMNTAWGDCVGAWAELFGNHGRGRMRGMGPLTVLRGYRS